MKLLVFNSIFVPLVALSLGAVAYIAHAQLQANAKEQVTQNAQIMMEVASSSRVYTTKQVQPLLQHKNFKLQSAIEEFRKALDDLPKDAGAVTVPDALDVQSKTEPGIRKQEVAVPPDKESVAPAPLVEPQPIVPIPSGLETSANATSEAKAKNVPSVPAKSSSSASIVKGETDSAPKKPNGLWRRLFGSSNKEEAVAPEKNAPGPSKNVAPAPETENAILPKPIIGGSTTKPPLARSAEPAKATSSSPEISSATVVDSSAKTPAGPTAKEGFILGRQQVLDEQRKYIESLKSKPEEMLDTEFHPQSVPAYAATEIFNVLHLKYPDYFYKEATLNPTNLRDRTSDWEADIVNSFRASPSLTELIGTRSTPTGDAFYLARPIKISNVSCLACHSTPDKAPPEMLSQYGSANGFGWKMDEIIGAQLVTVPTLVATKTAERSSNRLMFWLSGAFVGIIVTGNFGFGFALRQTESAGGRSVGS